MEKNIKILPYWLPLVVAIFSFIAIFDLPYGFYKLLRWIVFSVGIASAIHFYMNQRIGWIWMLAIVVLVFNPLFPFFFPKEIWRFFNVIAGISFLGTFCLMRLDEKKANNPHRATRYQPPSFDDDP